MKFAVLELVRRPGRFVVTSIALTLLVALLLFFGGLLDGLFQGTAGALDAQRADLVVFSGAARDQLVRSRITPDVRAQVERVPGVASADGLGISLVGAKVPGHNRFANAAVFGYEGGVRGVPAPPAPGEAWVDTSLRRDGVRRGQCLELGRGRVPVRVRGFVSNTSYLLQGGVWVAPETWRAVAGSNRPDAAVAPGVFSVLVVRVANGADDGAVGTRIDRATGGATSSLAKHDAVFKIPGVKEQEGTFSAIITTTFVITAIVVALFFALLVLERTRLFGVFKAIGASSAQLVGAVLTQALLLWLLAFLCGAVVVVALEGPLSTLFPFAVGTSRVVSVAIGVLVASVVGALISLRRIVRIDPASAIGGGA
jgi:putative ABC transport system permease protein